MSTTNPKFDINLDDDVDDLDDVLDQFSPAPPPPTAATLGPPTLGRPRQNTRVGAAPPSLPGSSGSKVDLPHEANEDELSKAFSEELVKGMEALMKGLGEDPSAAEDGKFSEEDRRTALKAAWEAMLIEGTDSGSGSGAQARSDHETTGGDFKARLKHAIDNLKESESKLQGASSTGATPESLEALFDSLGDGDSEKELEGFLETMMSQLLSKDVLYEPLKELSDGFPAYLAKPPSPISDEDRQRYLKQQACVSKILQVFDKSDYRDDHSEYSRQIMELMSEMQSCGSPPSEIMGDLPPGLDAIGKFDDKDCLIS
jgi:peroxin-19